MRLGPIAAAIWVIEKEGADMISYKAIRKNKTLSQVIAKDEEVEKKEVDTRPETVPKGSEEITSSQQ